MENSQIIMKSFLGCNFVDASHFTVYFPASFSKDTRDFAACMQSQERHGLEYVDCFLQMTQSCRARSLVFSKTIRFRVRWAEALLDKMPNFKLLYLFRDPRATVHSQMKWLTLKQNASQIAAELCTDMEDDLRNVKRLINLYPGRVKVIRYEDGATRPFQYARELYKFAGISMTEDIIRFISNITSTPMDPHNGVDIHRKHPLFTMLAWLSMYYPDIQSVDKHCQKLYPMLGYRPINSINDLVMSKQHVWKSNESMFHFL